MMINATNLSGLPVGYLVLIVTLDQLTCHVQPEYVYCHALSALAVYCHHTHNIAQHGMSYSMEAKVK